MKHEIINTIPTNPIQASATIDRYIPLFKEYWDEVGNGQSFNFNVVGLLTQLKLENFLLVGILNEEKELIGFAIATKVQSLFTNATACNWAYIFIRKNKRSTSNPIKYLLKNVVPAVNDLWGTTSVYTTADLMLKRTHEAHGAVAESIVMRYQ